MQTEERLKPPCPLKKTTEEKEEEKDDDIDDDAYEVDGPEDDNEPGR